MTGERGNYTALMITENGSDTCLLVQGSLAFPDAVDALRKLSEGEPLDEIFPCVIKVDADRFQQTVIRAVEGASDASGAYQVNIDADSFAALDPDRGWRMYRLSGALAASQGGAQIIDVLPVELRASRPVTERDFIFDESVEAVDDLLNFYLAVNCDVDELFGLRVMDSATDNYVNVYANYLLDSGQAADELELTLCRGDGVDVPMRYRLTDDERSMLLAKMKDYCQTCETPLNEWREQYLTERDVDTSASPPLEQSM